jgi:sugar phosphate isomerase/epimerase
MKFIDTSNILVSNHDSAEAAIKNALEIDSSYVFIDFSINENIASNWSLDRVEKIKNELFIQKRNAVCHGNFKNPIASYSLDKVYEARVDVAREIALAKVLKAPLILHPSAYDGIDKQSLDMDKATKALINCINFLDTLNPHDLWLENLPLLPIGSKYESSFCEEKSIRSILSSTSVKWLLDVGHAYVNQQLSFRLVEEFIHRIPAITIHDNFGKNDDHLPPGSGSIPFSEIFSMLKSCKWSGLIMIDCVPKFQIKEINTLKY